MRRLLTGLAIVVGTLSLSATPAAALDVGAVAVRSTFSGNDSCLAAPGEFATTITATGTISSGGQPYVGSFTIAATGTYVQGPCDPRSDFGPLVASLEQGTLTGQGVLGNATGTCDGGLMIMGSTTSVFGVRDPDQLGSYSLTCDVSVNGRPTQALVIRGELLGSRTPTSASHLGVYIIGLP